MSSFRPRGLPEHIIVRSDVGAWLRDSAVKQVTTHRTTRSAAVLILEHGVSIDRMDPDGAWGQGFYSSTIPDTRYGDASVPVAVRLLKPLVVDDPIVGAEQVEDRIARTGAGTIRDAIVAAGYDGVIVHFGPGDHWVGAFHDDQVKVVRNGRRT